MAYKNFLLDRTKIVKMKAIKEFLESSTIHGLAYISSSKKLARVFWTAVVASGFFIAAVLISQSFEGWKESPIKTTIETVPISTLTFPNVTVCPPRNTYTSLNYDLLMLQNVTINDDDREMLSDFALDQIQNVFHEQLMFNISKMEEENKFHNWYHGISKITLPHWEDDRGLVYEISTFATSGTVNSKYFGEQYALENVEEKLQYILTLQTPDEAVNNPNYTLFIEIEKTSMIVSNESINRDFEVFYIYDSATTTHFDAKSKIITHLLEGPKQMTWITFQRRVSREINILNSQILLTMPGFRIKWKYSHSLSPSVRGNCFPL